MHLLCSEPGFLSLCVCVWVDDWEEAFQTLKQVVKEYLLLEEQEEGENNNNNNGASPDNTSTGVCVFVCSDH